MGLGWIEFILIFVFIDLTFNKYLFIFYFFYKKVILSNNMLVDFRWHNLSGSNNLNLIRLESLE